MKKLILLCLLLSSLAGLAQVSTGDTIPDLTFTTVLNAPVKTIRLSQLKGKLVLIDFWATWCGSCIEAMPHLQSLQSTYGGRLQVIAVNDETPKRTAQYLLSRPANFWFAVDTARAIADVFPHQLIPHTILISPEGKLIAATSPQQITGPVIDSLLANQPVHLPEKLDNLLSYQDLIKQNFFAADTVQSRFMIQGAIKGGPGLSTTWLDDSTFSRRRLTCINLSLSTLYRLAYGNYPYSRTIDSTRNGRDAPVYCLDLIVQHPDTLLPSLRNELAARFDLRATIESSVRAVQVLYIIDPAKFRTIPRNTSGKRTYFAMHGEIDQRSINMQEFAEFLEDYGTGKLVVDETGNHEKLDIKFSFQPENPQSLLDILAGMGLGLRKEDRKIDMLSINPTTMSTYL
jgi:thiol-disulfide isomerase/thioredoxin